MKAEGGKKIGLWNIVGLGLGGAIGTGIFILLGFGIANAGRAILPVVIVGCFFMLLAYWYNLAMPSMFVIEGGDYSMKAMLCSPTMSGFGAFLTIVNAFVLSGYAIAMVDYAAIVWPALDGFRSIAALVITTIFFASSIKGSRFITILENIVTLVLIAALVLFIGFGIGQVDPSAFFENTSGNPFFLGGIGGFVSALAIMGWACQGTTMAPVSMAAVTKNPKRNIPLGIVIITLCLAVIYGLMAYVAGGVLPYDQIAGQNISVTAKAIFPHGIYMFFVLGGGIGAIAYSYIGGLGMFRYPLIQIAEDGWLPEFFKKQTKSGYPYMTYLMFYLISVFPIVTGMSLDAVVSLVMIPAMIMNIYMNLACFNLPSKFKAQWENRSLRMPVWFWKVCCVLGAFCAGVVTYNLFKGLNGRDMIICVIICVVLFALSVLRLKQGAVSREGLEKSKERIIEEAINADVEEENPKKREVLVNEI